MVENNKLLSLIKFALRNPRLTFSLLSFERIRNFWITLCSKDRTVRNSVFCHYEDLYTHHSQKKHTTPHITYNEVNINLATSNTPQLSIVIPVYNQWKYTARCLNSIGATCVGLKYEIILVDDCSTDETTQVKERFPEIKYIRNEQNFGYLLSCNRGASVAKGDYIFLLNNDTVLHAGAVSALIRTLDLDSQVVIAGSKLLYPDGRIQEAGCVMNKDASPWSYGRLSPSDVPECEYLKEVDYVSGASLLVRKKFWEQVGGYDPLYAPAYYEDADISYKARAAGYSVVYQPASVVTHDHRVSYGTSLTTSDTLLEINQKKFFDRWKLVLADEDKQALGNLFYRRDRSFGKKKLLIIDHKIPTPDQDAGSKSTFLYLKLFTEMGLSVTFLADDSLPRFQYKAELEAMGIEVLCGDYYRKHWQKWLQKNGNSFDFAYVHRPNIASKYLQEIRSNSTCKIIYQCHDLHSVRLFRQFELSQDIGIKKQAQSIARLERSIFKNVDTILTFSADEVLSILEEVPEKEVLQIPLYLYDEIASQAKKARRSPEILFVGSFAHPPNKDAVNWFCTDVLPDVLKRNPETVFHIVGSGFEGYQPTVSKGVRIHGRVSDAALEALYSQVAVVVAPLRFGAGVKGKVIEALWREVPVVSTPVGTEGVSGLSEILLPVTDASEMVKRIESCFLGADDINWQHCRSWLQANFSVSKAKEIFSTIFA